LTLYFTVIVITLGLISSQDVVEKAWNKLWADPPLFQILMTNLMNRLPFNVQLIHHYLGVICPCLAINARTSQLFPDFEQLTATQPVDHLRGFLTPLLIL